MTRGITTRTGQRLTRFDRGRVSWARVTRLNLKATYFSDFTKARIFNRKTNRSRRARVRILWWWHRTRRVWAFWLWSMSSMNLIYITPRCWFCPERGCIRGSTESIQPTIGTLFYGLSKFSYQNQIYRHLLLEVRLLIRGSESHWDFQNVEFFTN